MDTLFPFGFPLPTAFYLTLYLVTLVVHVLTMNYVLAGSAYLAVVRWRSTTVEDHNPAARLLADWMPLMLSVAITAGIAPLLFIQILYRTQFYTANLLLFHRWMAILPVLIVGFYLLYLIRKPRLLAGRLWLRRGLTWIVFACFAFIGWSWTENHLLSLQSQDVWNAEYLRAGLIFRHPELLPRLTTWFLGSFPALAIWLLWQLHWTGPVADVSAFTATEESRSRIELESTRQQLTWLGLGALGLATLSASAYVCFLPENDRQVLWSPLSLPWIGLAILGAALQVVCFLRMLVTRCQNRRSLLLATSGVFLTTLGVAVARESLRLKRLELTNLFPQHADAYAIGGFGVFLLFAVVNTALIVWCIRLTKQRA